MKKKLMLMLLILSIFILNIASDVYAANLEAGEQIFSANCSACHAGGNNAIMPEKTLKIDVLEKNSMNDIQAIRTQVKNGKNAMPSFSGGLTDEDIDNVANFVLSKSQAGW